MHHDRIPNLQQVVHACISGWVCLELIFVQPLGDGAPTLDPARVYVFDGGSIGTDCPHGDRHEVLVCQ